jgi:hypothetical protein
MSEKICPSIYELAEKKDGLRAWKEAYLKHQHQAEKNKIQEERILEMKANRQARGEFCLRSGPV